MLERAYCTLAEVLSDLSMDGLRDEDRFIRHIRAASEFIEHEIGIFVPVTETKQFDGRGKTHLFTGPILSISSITDDGDTLTSSDYIFYPRDKHWENGPYSRLAVDPDATNLSVWHDELDSVEIAGVWGKYDLTEATGATATLADGTGTSLVVDTAAKISPGAVLLIESEQLFVYEVGSATDSNANTGEEVDVVEEVITTSDGTKFNIGEIIKIDFEQMKVLDISGNDIAVVRGWNETAKATHSNATDIYVYRTFNVVRGANGTTGVAHSAKAVSRQIPPMSINYLCRQIASLMEMKARSGFAGKVGNVELGEVFYHDEFPKKQIRQLKRQYWIGL